MTIGLENIFCLNYLIIRKNKASSYKSHEKIYNNFIFNLKSNLRLNYYKNKA